MARYKIANGVTIMSTGPVSGAMFTPEILEIMRKGVYNNLNYRQIAESIGFEYSRFTKLIESDSGGIVQKMKLYKVEAMLESAERVSREILAHSEVKSDKSIDSSLLAIKQREAAFLRQNLIIARETYDVKGTTIVNVTAPQPILGNVFDNLVKRNVQIVDDEQLDS